LVRQLIINGIDTVFCVPGESYLEVLDALWDERETIRTVQCRHEAAAANMADAYGKLTGRPGICFVTRGPGATHAATGVHTAKQDSTPLILFVGQVARHARDREAFQEIDYGAMFGTVAKWAAEISDPNRVSEYVHRAFVIATSGRPGPVVLALPEDMLAAASTAPDTPAAIAAQPGATSSDMAALKALLDAARAPIAILGGGGWTAKASAAFTRFAEKAKIPVAASFRRQDLIDNDSASYIGHLGVAADPGLLEHVRQSDVVLAIGTRLEETVSQGYTLFDLSGKRQKIVHVHPDANEIGRVYHATLGINAAVEPFAEAVLPLTIDGSRWAARTQAAREDYEATGRLAACPGDLDLSAIMVWLRDRLPPDAIVANGAGNYAIWVHRFLRWHRPATQLAPTSGAMGYGLPAAIAAKLHYPQRVVLAFAGDGCFMMAGSELATAVQHGAPVIVIVINNGMYGTIRMHQERRYSGRVIATELNNPDLVAYAKAFGCQAETIRKTGDFAAAFERALTAQAPVLLELVLHQDAISPSTTLSRIRAAYPAAAPSDLEFNPEYT
jgi:acetolactate synthase-1/2/3 large subunit